MKFMKCSVVTAVNVLILCCLLVGCKSKTVFVPVESIRTVKEIETVRDTILQVKLVPYYSETATEKDSSYLENEYAYSEAKFDGKLLHHSLGIFDKNIPYKTKYVDRYIHISDSIPVPYQVVEYREINILTSFQSFQIWCGRILLLIISLWCAYKFIKKIVFK